MVALGMINAGLFCNDEATFEKFLDAMKISGEKFWRLPCTDDYKDQIKSQIADIMNTGRNPVGRRDLGGDVPEGVCGGYTVGASGYCGLCLERRGEAVAPEWAERHCGAVDY